MWKAIANWLDFHVMQMNSFIGCVNSEEWQVLWGCFPVPLQIPTVLGRLGKMNLNVKIYDAEKYPSPFIPPVYVSVIKGVTMQYKQIILSTTAISHWLRDGFQLIFS